MRRLVRTVLPAVAGLLLARAATARAQYAVYAITNTSGNAQQLVRFDSSNPNVVTFIGFTGADLQAIDFRPLNNVLYGYDGSMLYTIDLGTGAATQVFDVGNAAGDPGFDFNPTVDRVRVVDAAGTNLRLNPNDGATTPDTPYAYAPGDVSAGQTPTFTAVAYTNSDADPNTGTTLYGLDANVGRLVTISNPNGGVVNTVGSLGLGTGLTISGFDIVTVGGSNVALFTDLVAGRGPVSRLYSVNLATGAASMVGTVGATLGVRGIAATTIPEPGTYALVAAGLGGLAGVARRRRGIPGTVWRREHARP